MNRAILIHSKSSPEELIQAVNAHPSPDGTVVCPLVWSQEGESLILEKKGTAPISLVGSINRCAQAIEQTR